MAEERIAERIDANLMNITMDDLHTLQRRCLKHSYPRYRKDKRKVNYQRMPQLRHTRWTFQNLIKELALKRSFKPDIIFIDYLNICIFKIQNTNVGSYFYIKAAEELRGLAETNVPIMSAAQTTRTGYTSTDIGLEDT